jgi:GlpG protein
LLTQGITSRVLPESDGFGLWVHREDDVARASEEYARFLENPSGAIYSSATEAATRERARRAKIEKDHERATIHVRNRWTGPSFARCPVTFVIMGVTIVIAILTRIGADRRALEPFLFTSYILEFPRDAAAYDLSDRTAPIPVTIRSDGLEPIRKGQVWRLLTPMFVHFGPIHLAFNLYWFYHLAGAIEQARGRWRTLALVLILGVGANLAEYYWQYLRAGPDAIARFGGLSGVLYGLFGYLWMKSEYAPQLGLRLTSQTISVMLIWLVVCMTGVVGSVANAAHLGGLGIGILLGIWPHLLRARQ